LRIVTKELTGLFTRYFVLDRVVRCAENMAIIASRRALVGCQRDTQLTRCGKKVTRSTRPQILEGSPAVALVSGMHAKVIPAKTLQARWPGGHLARPPSPVERPAGAPNKCALHIVLLSRSVTSRLRHTRLIAWLAVRSVQFLRHAVSSLSLNALSPFGRRSRKVSKRPTRQERDCITT
jgi:hypothetical protein